MKTFQLNIEANDSHELWDKLMVLVSLACKSKGEYQRWPELVNQQPDGFIAVVDAERRIRIVDGQIPQIPHDQYLPVHEYYPVRQSATDAIGHGHWVWERRLLGFRGEATHIMLGPEWQNVLEASQS